MKKKVRLTLSSTNEELLYTMINEGQSVEYWHKKHYGGPRKYDKWQDEQLEKVQNLPAGSELMGEMVDYHSLVTGNRWKSFEVTTSYGVGNAFTRMFRFCYWDTYGSVGAFYNCSTSDGRHGLLVFPSHFFHRYADRMDIHHSDAALVCEFFNRNHAFAIDMSHEPDEEGHRQFIIGAKEGVCYGFSRTKIETPEDLYGNDNVFEVRTFLKYEQLNNRQLKECQRVRQMSEDFRLTDDAPAIHSIGRAITDKDYAEKMESIAARRFGLNAQQMQDCMKINYAVFHVADFVSSDIRNPLHALANGNAYEEGRAEAIRLMEIVASRIRETPDYFKSFSSYELLDITHEWKGDSYDWNKWFWSYLNNMRKVRKTDDEKEWYEYYMQKCKEHALTYQLIADIIKSMRSAETNNKTE